MNLESTGDCALSAQRGEAAYEHIRERANELLKELQENVTLALNDCRRVHTHNIRLTLRDIARLFDIPVTGQD